MRDGPVPGRSVLGTPIEPVPEADRRADVRFTVPPPARSSIGSVVAVEVEVHNPTTTPWPTLSTDPTDLVMLAHRVVTPDGAPVGRTQHRDAFPGRLPYDLAGGERVRVGFWVNRPGEPGRYELEVWLEQSGHRFAGSVLRQEIVFD